MERAGEVKEFTVSAQNYSFTPSTLTVNKGDRVRITFTNSGGTHDFVLDEFNVKTSKWKTGIQKQLNSPLIRQAASNTIAQLAAIAQWE